MAQVIMDHGVSRHQLGTRTPLNAPLQRELRDRRRAAESPFAQDAEIYYNNAGLSGIPDIDEQVELMRIPTTLYLTDEQIGRLLSATSPLIHNNPDFRRLMQDIEAAEE